MDHKYVLMLKIGEFSKLTHVTVKTLRHYDKVGLLKAAWINRYNGYRYYRLNQVGQLNRIVSMKELGFSLEQIRKLLSENPSGPALRKMLVFKKAELEQLIYREQERLRLIEIRLQQLDEGGKQPDQGDIVPDNPDLYKEIIAMEVNIVTKKAFKVVGMEVVSKNENGEIPELWQKMGPRWKELGEVNDPEKFYGVCGPTEEDGRFLYIAGQEVEEIDELPAGMQVIELPEQSYAVLRCKIPTIGETYEYAFKTWIPQSEYEYVSSPDFELYDEDFSPENSEVDPLYIYIPVKKKV